jgi:hypothetical protein
MTLFVVAAVLLVLIMRDQHKALDAMKIETEKAGAAVAVPASAVVPAADAGADGEPAASEPGHTAAEPAAPEPGTTDAQKARAHVAAVERGRIATMGGVVSLIWLVTLVLMVWNS